MCIVKSSIKLFFALVVFLGVIPHQVYALDSSSSATTGKIVDETKVAVETGNKDKSMQKVLDWAPGSTAFMFPGEPLPEDQIRVTIMGSGWGYDRPAQVGASIYVELGNGESFIFDIGQSSSGNYKKMQIPYSKMTNIFLTHLHMDHVGDLPDLWTFGPTTDRTKPINVYGPSGDTPELGTAYAIENMKKYGNWNLVSFEASLPASDGFKINVHEFDFRKNNNVVYDKNGVVIKSFPAAHTIDGAVSYRLDWNGLSVVISGDTNPTMFMVENAKGADLILHEAAPLPRFMVEKMGYKPEVAERIVDSSHTPPKALGKIFELTKPRMGVITHTLRNTDTIGPVTDLVRIHYDGPLTFGADLMVFNISKDSILQRMAVGPEYPWMYLAEPQPDTQPSRKLTDYKSQKLFDQVIPECSKLSAEQKKAGKICF